MFQTISCYKPRNLITFNVNLNTILAFIQDDSELKVSRLNHFNQQCLQFIFFSVYFQTYIYRDGSGFVEFSSFKMPSLINQMIHYEIVLNKNRQMNQISEQTLRKLFSVCFTKFKIIYYIYVHCTLYSTFGWFGSLTQFQISHITRSSGDASAFIAHSNYLFNQKNTRHVK